MKKRIGIILIVLGIAAALAAAALYSVYEARDKEAGENARILLEEFEAQLKTDNVPYESESGTLPQRRIYGREVVGVIRVPSVGIELPVLENWSYDALKIAPCRYSGSVKGNDLIILGHNYKSHFTPLKNVSIGDEIEFCDVNGVTYTYVVEKTEKLYKTELDRLTDIGTFDLTLFTCTAGGESRFVVRCKRAE
ncbi:MAG: sortase [Clostridia bacterium]|nr:sortase [Clostridia bacterium]